MHKIKHSTAQSAKTACKSKVAKDKAKPFNKTKGSDKDAERCHRALECQFDKVRRQTDIFPVHSELATLTPTEGVTGQQLFGGSTLDVPSTSSLPQGLGAPNSSGVVRQLLEATFTPTSAGLRAGEGQQPNQNLGFQSIISDAISKILTF